MTNNASMTVSNGETACWQPRIAALKDGLDAVEARARTALGMVAEGETFFLVVDDGTTEPEDEGGLPTP